MNDLVAKTIIKNKYWVVEQSGKKVATIQAVENGGFVYVHDNLRETHASVKNIKSKYNIKFAGVDKKSKAEENLVYVEKVKHILVKPILAKILNKLA